MLSGEQISIKLIEDTFVVDYRSEFCERALAKSKSLVSKMELGSEFGSPNWNWAETFTRQRPFFTLQWPVGDWIFPALYSHFQ